MFWFYIVNTKKFSVVEVKKEHHIILCSLVFLFLLIYILKWSFMKSEMLKLLEFYLVCNEIVIEFNTIAALIKDFVSVRRLGNGKYRFFRVGLVLISEKKHLRWQVISPQCSQQHLKYSVSAMISTPQISSLT